MTDNHAVATGTPDATATSGTTPRRGALLAYQWGLLVFLLAGATQIALAGLGAFTLESQGDAAFAPHRALGFTMAGIAVIVLVLALIAQPGLRAIVLSAVLVLLTSLMQSLLAGLADDHAAFGALHAADGLLILAIPAYLYARARQRRG